MSEVHGLSKSHFELVGTVEGKRIITSAKHPEFKLHVLKVAIPGSTLEVDTSAEEFERATLDTAYCISGKISKEGDYVKLQLRSIKPVSEVKTMSRSAGL